MGPWCCLLRIRDARMKQGSCTKCAGIAGLILDSPGQASNLREATCTTKILRAFHESSCLSAGYVRNFAPIYTLLWSLFAPISRVADQGWTAVLCGRVQVPRTAV